MNQTVPEMVRIGVGTARIKCVTPQRVEYFDEAGQECDRTSVLGCHEQETYPIGVLVFSGLHMLLF